MIIVNDKNNKSVY